MPLSRRSFLGQATLAASAPALTAANRGRVLGANDCINVALIGVGNLGLRHLRERLLPLAREKKPDDDLRPHGGTKEIET